MTVNELLGLPAEATQEQMLARVQGLAHAEANLLKVTGKETVADAIGVVLAGKDASAKLTAAEKALREWEESAAVMQAAKAKAEIGKLVSSAVDTKHYGVSRDEFVALATGHGETYGVPALQALLASYPDRVRHIQAPMPGSSPAEMLRQLERATSEYMVANPGASKTDAQLALAKERPALFSEGGR